jgi:ribonuclease HII
MQARNIRSKEGLAMLRFERAVLRKGYTSIAGVDEAGRGPLAGPVVAAAVILPTGKRMPGVIDSKLLRPEQRIAAFNRIVEQAVAIGIGVVPADQIDAINIYQASKLAARLAVEQLCPAPDFILTDALPLESTGIPFQAIIKGDLKSQSIAAASIVAKVTRDRIMTSYDRDYPQYDFAHNKGYACPKHLEALTQIGPCTIHRHTYKGVFWFDQEPIHSQTFHEMSNRVKNSRSIDQLRELRQMLTDLDRYLPPREVYTLHAAISKQEAQLEQPKGIAPLETPARPPW